MVRSPVAVRGTSSYTNHGGRPAEDALNSAVNAEPLSSTLTGQPSAAHREAIAATTVASVTRCESPSTTRSNSSVDTLSVHRGSRLRFLPFRVSPPVSNQNLPWTHKAPMPVTGGGGLPSLLMVANQYVCRPGPPVPGACVRSPAQAVPRTDPSRVTGSRKGRRDYVLACEPLPEPSRLSASTTLRAHATAARRARHSIDAGFAQHPPPRLGDGTTAPVHLRWARWPPAGVPETHADAAVRSRAPCWGWGSFLSARLGRSEPSDQAREPSFVARQRPTCRDKSRQAIARAGR